MNDILQEFKTVAAATDNPRLAQDRQTGRRVMGYFCSSVPEELIHAAGFIPYRMNTVQSGGTMKGDVYFSSMNCSFVRHCFNKAMDHAYDFIDGVVFTNACDHIRRMFDNWRDAKKNEHIRPDFLHMFVVPHVVGINALERFTDEIRLLKKALENFSGAAISDHALEESIRLYNERRRLLRAIYRKRERDNPPLAGSEWLTVMMAITVLPVEDGIALLRELDKKTETRSIATEDRIRVFLTGGCVEEISHVELIESCGALVVADNVCPGYKYIDGDIEPSGDPLRAIAERYLSRLSCPRMIDDFSRRMTFLRETVKTFRADAVIAERLLFCDLWAGEIFLIKKELQKLNKPIFALEREMFSENTEQVRTRIQAFVEQVRNS